MSFDWEEDTNFTTNTAQESFSGFGEDLETTDTPVTPNPTPTVSAVIPEVTSAFSPEPTHFSAEEDTLYKWRLEHEESLRNLDQQLESQKKKNMDTARKELEDFYRKREENKQKDTLKRQETEKETIRNRDSLLKSENPWDRVSAFVDFKAVHTGEKDTSQMKKILISLKSK